VKPNAEEFLLVKKKELHASQKRKKIKIIFFLIFLRKNVNNRKSKK